MTACDQDARATSARPVSNRAPSCRLGKFGLRRNEAAFAGGLEYGGAIAFDLGSNTPKRCDCGVESRELLLNLRNDSPLFDRAVQSEANRFDFAENSIADDQCLHDWPFVSRSSRLGIVQEIRRTSRVLNRDVGLSNATSVRKQAERLRRAAITSRDATWSARVLDVARTSPRCRCSHRA